MDRRYDEWFYGTPYERLDGFIKSCARSNTCSIA